jgi:hypothetical protein
LTSGAVEQSRSRKEPHNFCEARAPALMALASNMMFNVDRLKKLNHTKSKEKQSQLLMIIIALFKNTYMSRSLIKIITRSRIKRSGSATLPRGMLLFTSTFS